MRRDIKKRHRHFPTHLFMCASPTLLSFDFFRKTERQENCGKQLLWITTAVRWGWRCSLYLSTPQCCMYSQSCVAMWISKDWQDLTTWMTAPRCNSGGQKQKYTKLRPTSSKGMAPKSSVGKQIPICPWYHTEPRAKATGALKACVILPVAWNSDYSLF